jgi:predicted AAA+ superfamily ATPase
MLVDEKRIPKQFVLTGSVNVLRLKDVKDSLAGRMTIYTLWPLSQDEILGEPSCFLDHLFNQSISGRFFDMSDVNQRVQKGGYPLSVLCDTPQERQQWFLSYLEQILSKDIRDLSNIEGLKDIPNILNLLATRVGGLLNITDLSRSLGIPHTTLKRYLSLLEMAYLFCPVPPWFQNIGKRLSKSDKVFLNDTALIESILHRDTSSDPNLFGHVLENFVMNELIKQISYHHTPLRLFHYRTLSGQEIDFIVEKSNGDIVGIEVKAASRFSHKDVTSLISMKQHPQFKAGVMLYRGTEILPIDDHIYAVPLSYLWTAHG